MVYISQSDYAEDAPSLREHPWTCSDDNPEEKYVDFKTQPELIEEVLLSFKSWKDYAGTRQFYELIRWLNSSESRLETNDCRFEGIEENSQEDTFPKKYVGRGSVMLFYRALQHNLSPLSSSWIQSRLASGLTQLLPPGDRAVWLRDACEHYLRQTNPHFRWGAVEISLFTTRYRTLPLPEEAQFGHEVLLRFWAWGDDETETMANFAEVVSSMRESLSLVSAQVAEKGG